LHRGLARTSIALLQGREPLVRESLDTRPSQHRVLRQITEALGRTLGEGLKECTGREVPVFFSYQGDALKKPHVTAIHYWIERVNDRHPDRVLCKTPEGDEFFRMPPLFLTGRWLVTAWAPAPEDQELLAGAMRVLYDSVELKPAQPDEPDPKTEDAVHWEDHVTLDLSQRLTLDEARLICESLGMPLRASIRYDISFRLDSERKTTVKRVKERIVDYKKLDG
jgi:hypothetical protein